VRNRNVLRLFAGFKRFRDKYFIEDQTHHPKLSEPQSPKTLIIGCSDSRVDPALITSASPGELFIVRNIANLVPPYESASSGLHGVSAAIEFAVINLKVENIVVLGHRQCGGIRSLMSKNHATEISFVSKWMQIAEDARKKVLKDFASLSPEDQCRECEKEAILASLKNLKTFPFVQDALRKREVNIFGIYFDLEQGTLNEYDETSKAFKPLSVARLTTA
jgi:carbonic anhydrase